MKTNLLIQFIKKTFQCPLTNIAHKNDLLVITCTIIDCPELCSVYISINYKVM